MRWVLGFTASWILLSWATATAVLAELQQVHVVFRHGDRTPTSLYPKDPNEPGDFPEGLGHITIKGKRDQYELGKYLRTRYDGFLSSHPNEAKARSSGRDRCLESIQTTLASLYQPTGQRVWNECFHWQPVPVQTMPVLLDGMLYEDSLCPEAEEALEEVRKSPEGTSVLEDNYEVMQLLQNNSGKTMKDWVSVRDLFDTLTIEKSRNLAIPDWAPPLWEQMANISKYTYILNYQSQRYLRFRAGLLIKDMMKHFQEIVNGTSRSKLYIYASHDVAVAALTSAFGVYNRLPVPPSTTVITELHKNSSGTEASLGGYFVQMYFKNATDFDPYLLDIQDCGTKCPLDKFLTLAATFAPCDWRQECGVAPIPDGVDLYS